MQYRIVYSFKNKPQNSAPWIKANDLEGAIQHAASYVKIFKAARAEVEDENGKLLFSVDNPDA